MAQVGIDDNEPFARGRAGTGDDCSGKAERGRLALDQLDRRRTGEGPNRFTGAVGRPIIDEDNLIGRRLALPDPGQERLDVVDFIQGRYDERDHDWVEAERTFSRT